MIMKKVALTDICGFLGTLSSFGFLVAYILICIGAPVALARIKAATAWNVLFSLLADRDLRHGIGDQCLSGPAGAGQLLPVYLPRLYVSSASGCSLPSRRRYPNI